MPTRERLIVAMADAMRRKGVSGVGLSEILAAAKAPKGVLYHHFPGGKAQLTVSAVNFSVDRFIANLDRLIAESGDLPEAITAWVAAALRHLEESRFEIGCPLATVALESTAEDVEVRQAIALGFQRIKLRLVEALAASGLPEPRASALASTLVAAYEGALIQARVSETTTPIREMTDCLIDLIKFELRGRA